MSKIKKQYVCSNCGMNTLKWSGQCFECKTWGSITEEIIDYNKAINKNSGIPQSLNFINNKNISQNISISTGMLEFDRVLGEGLVLGSIVLIGGDPGIGKSTLLLQLSNILPKKNLNCLYVTGEESIKQITLRANRLGIEQNDQISLISCTNLDDIIATINKNKEKSSVVIIDSIQTISSSMISSGAGSVSQIRYCTQELINYCKTENIILIMSCHVTKDGQLAGPKVLEHMVDTVLYFEGDSNYHFRILRSIKNRFGAVNEIAVFEMKSFGLEEVKNPSELFLSDRQNEVSGSSIFASIEGSRAFLVEVQALIAPSNIPTPRRSVIGWDLNRLSMILAVLNVRFGLNLSTYEVYLSILGGLKINEPAADMAVVAALISAINKTSIPSNTVFFGEIGLTGEVRRVSRSDVRIKEAEKMGFNKIICGEKSQNILVTEVKHIKELYNILKNSSK